MEKQPLPNRLQRVLSNCKIPICGKISCDSREIEDGATHLIELKRLINEHNKKEKQVPLREPDLMIVLTGGKMAYTRPDGVKVIPLGCLKN